MEGITRQSGDDRPLKRLKEAQRILTASSRDRAQIDRDAAQALTRLQQETSLGRTQRPEAEGATGKPVRDSIDISAAARGSDPEREARVVELREKYEAGTLNTRERLEQAAEGLLKTSN